MTNNQLNILRLLAKSPRWTMTMTDELRKTAGALAKMGLVEFVQRAPDRRGNLRGIAAVVTEAGLRKLNS